MAEGTRFTPRPTTYKGIQMRSRLEAKYAQWLDGQRIAWEYEPRCFASDEGQYLPDFRLTDIDVMGDNRTVYVEVKPNLIFGPGAETVQLWSRVIGASEPGAYLLLEVRDRPTPILVPPSIYRSISMPVSWTRLVGGSVGLALLVPTDWREVA